jgi:hypothetical protein
MSITLMKNVNNVSTPESEVSLVDEEPCVKQDVPKNGVNTNVQLSGIYTCLYISYTQNLLQTFCYYCVYRDTSFYWFDYTSYYYRF